MYKTISGYCPTLDKEYSILIEYKKVFGRIPNVFIKNEFRCEHNIYGDACPLSDCPLYDAAPDDPDEL